MQHRPIVFTDIETTGGSSRNGRIIDIGAIRVENGKVVKVMNQLIDPGCPVPYFITQLTGITNDMVWSAPKFESIGPQLEELLDGALFAAHHVDFDYSFVKTEFKRAGVTFNHDRLCTVKLSRSLHPEHQRHGLDNIIDRMNLNVKNRHRGYDDAEVLSKFFFSETDEDKLRLFSSMEGLTVYARNSRSAFKSTQMKFF